MLLQGHGRREDLHGGAGLVAVLHRMHLARGLLALHLAAVFLLLRSAPLGFRAVQEPLGHDVVRVEGGRAGHGQDLAGLGVHHHGVGGGGVAALDALLQGLLHDVLDGRIDGELEGGAVHRDLGVVLPHDEEPALGVPGGDELAGLARELLVEGALDAQLAHAVDVDEPHDLAGQAAPGVVALALGEEVHPFDLQGPDGCDLAGGQLALDPHEGLLAQQPLQDGRARHFQDGRQLGGHLLGALAVRLTPVALRVPLPGPEVGVEGGRVGEEALHLEGDGQGPAPAVPQLAPDGGDGHHRGVLAFGPEAVVAVLDALEPQEPQGDQQDPEQGAPQDPGQPGVHEFRGLGPPQEAPGRGRTAEDAADRQ